MLTGANAVPIGPQLDGPVYQPCIGQCSRCLSFKHNRASCLSRTRCISCFRLGHPASASRLVSRVCPKPPPSPVKTILMVGTIWCSKLVWPLTLSDRWASTTATTPSCPYTSCPSSSSHYGKRPLPMETPRLQYIQRFGRLKLLVVPTPSTLRPPPFLSI